MPSFTKLAILTFFLFTAAIAFWMYTRIGRAVAVAQVFAAYKIGTSPLDPVLGTDSSDFDSTQITILLSRQLAEKAAGSQSLSSLSSQIGLTETADLVQRSLGIGVGKWASPGIYTLHVSRVEPTTGVAILNAVIDEYGRFLKEADDRMQARDSSSDRSRVEMKVLTPPAQSR